MTLVVFAGQSNALGFGMSSATAPPGWGGLDWRTFIWNPDVAAFELMIAGVNTGSARHPEAWGPEVAFARAFREANPFEPLYIVKAAKGSTGLAADPDRLDWSPRSEGELFDATALEVSRARSALNGADVDAVFLVQGEQDASNAAAAQAYQTNLAEWIAGIRSVWMQDPAGHVGFIRINDSQAHFETVRWAQVAVDLADARAASLETYDLAMQADGLHYAAEGHLQIGLGFFSLFDAWT